MKVGILAGGYGTRLAEETQIRPKPMVEIGGMPIIWHIMMIYYSFGYKDFSIALGYKGDYIKRWFVEYGEYSGNISVNTSTGEVVRHQSTENEQPLQPMPDWNVDLVDTGIDTMTAGRIKRLIDWAGNERMMVTWGDGVADIDVNKLLAFHESHGKLVTMTAVRPTARYGHIEMDGERVAQFNEKPQTMEGWINGAFFVLEPGVADYIRGDNEMFEHAPMQRLAEDGELMAYRHDSFWQCMDTLREKHILQTMWDSGNAPWKMWS